MLDVTTFAKSTFAAAAAAADIATDAASVSVPEVKPVKQAQSGMLRTVRLASAASLASAGTTASVTTLETVAALNSVAAMTQMAAPAALAAERVRRCVSATAFAALAVAVTHAIAGAASTTTLHVTVVAKAVRLHRVALAPTKSLPQAVVVRRFRLAATAVERIAMHRALNDAVLRRGVNMTVYDLLRANIGRENPENIRVRGCADRESNQHD